MPFQTNQTPVMNPALNNLFQSVRNAPVGVTLKRGSLAVFKYGFWKHDPYPLVMVTDVFPNSMLRGLNLHFLTFPFIKQILRMGCGQNFSYANIKDQQYIVNAFRSYKWQGVSQIKMLDCNFLLTVMATVRSFDPNQIVAIRKSVQEQISREVNRPAQATPEMPIGQTGI